MGFLGLAPSDLPPPILVSASGGLGITPFHGVGIQIPVGSLRGCVSTQVPQPGGVTAKRRGGCAGRKSRRPDELRFAKRKIGYGRPQPQHAGAGPLRGGRWGVVGSRYPISELRSSAAEAAPADRVREVGDSPSFAANPFGGTASEGRPDFSVRYE